MTDLKTIKDMFQRAKVEFEEERWFDKIAIRIRKPNEFISTLFFDPTSGNLSHIMGEEG